MPATCWARDHCKQQPWIREGQIEFTNLVFRISLTVLFHGRRPTPVMENETMYTLLVCHEWTSLAEQIGTDITVTSNTAGSLPAPTWGASAIPFLMRTGLCGGGQSEGCFCQLCWSLPGCWYTPQQWLQSLLKTSAEATVITGWLSQFTEGTTQKTKGYHHYVAGELKGYKIEELNKSWIQNEKNPNGRKSHELFN